MARPKDPRGVFRRAVSKLSIPEQRKAPTKENALWFMRQGYMMTVAARQDAAPALEAAKVLANEP